MKNKKLNFRAFILILAATVTVFGACRAKKPVAVEPPAVEVVEEKQAAAAPAEEKEVAPVSVPEKMPDFNYSNIQFEFNSAVLKTSSYGLLDQIATEIRKYPEAKFNLNGHSSLEGSEQRNMTLSIDRANSVKSYLVNVGVVGSNLTTVGFGESKPVASNETESGRILNRRVEIEKID